MIKLILGSRFRTSKGTYIVTAVCWEHGKRTGVEYKPEREGIKPSYLSDEVYYENYNKVQHLGE